MTKPGSRERSFGLARVLGGIGALASCVPMVAMMPAGFATALSFVGLGASSAAVHTLAPHLNPIAQPLLLLSAALLAVTSLRCSLAAVFTASSGGLLMYLGMYVWTDPGGVTNPSLFYPGLGLFLSTYLVSFAQRRLAASRPLVRPALGRGLVAGTLVIGAALVTASAAGYSARRWVADLAQI